MTNEELKTLRQSRTSLIRWIGKMTTPVIAVAENNTGRLEAATASICNLDNVIRSEEAQRRFSFTKEEK